MAVRGTAALILALALGACADPMAVPMGPPMTATQGQTTTPMPMNTADTPLVVEGELFAGSRLKEVRGLANTSGAARAHAATLEPMGTVSLIQGVTGPIPPSSADPMLVLRGFHQGSRDEILPLTEAASTMLVGVGSYRVQRYRIAAPGRHRGTHCVGFAALFDPPGAGARKMLWGQSCTAEPLPDDEIHRSLSRIGVKGFYVPPTA